MRCISTFRYFPGCFRQFALHLLQTIHLNDLTMRIQLFTDGNIQISSALFVHPPKNLSKRGFSSFLPCSDIDGMRHELLPRI